ncbi:MAG: pts system fructose component [Deltaproteobacteria bacterium]|nr:pts system fructose component [Deltaproteobacteria bacterium]
MVGAVIIAHSFIGKELIATAEYFVGPMNGIAAVSINCKMEAFEARQIISETMKQVDKGDGVLMLKDLFGGSSSNLAFSFLNKEKVEVITGINLPMILTFWNKRESMGLRELAKNVQLSGRRSIVRAKDLLDTKGDAGGKPFTRVRQVS